MATIRTWRPVITWEYIGYNYRELDDLFAEFRNMMLRSAIAYLFTAAVFLFYLYPKVRAEAVPQIFGQASHPGLHPASFAASQAGVGPNYGISPSYYNPGSGYYGSNYGPIYGGRAPYPIGGGYPPLGHPNYGHPYSSAAASSSI